MLSSQGGAFFVKMTNVWGLNLKRPRSFPARSLLFLRLRCRLLRTEHIQKRRKAKSLDGTYTRSLQMVKNIFWKDKQNTCKGCKREVVRQLPT